MKIIEASYPADAPTQHAEQSRRIVGIASLLVCPEPLPMLGVLGRWEWESKPDTTWEADPTNARDDFWRKVSQPPAQDGPHKIPLHMLHARIEGREEVLFQRMPGEPRELQHQWGDLSSFRKLLRVAVEELEQLPAMENGNNTPTSKLRQVAAAMRDLGPQFRGFTNLSAEAPPARHRQRMARQRSNRHAGQM